MSRTPVFDRKALAALLDKQHGVISREQALTCGMSRPMVRYRRREAGPWRVLLPGVYLSHTGTATDEQRDMAALLYAGPRSMLSGPAALRRHGVRTPRSDLVDVLVPRATRRQDAGFARLHRTARLPGLVCVAGEISYVPAPRAVADAVRDMTGIREVRAVVADSVQRGICPVPRLAEELAAGPVPRFRAVTGGAGRGRRRHQVIGGGRPALPDQAGPPAHADVQPAAVRRGDLHRDPGLLVAGRRSGGRGGLARMAPVPA
jgi:hypothetical protein